MANSKDRTMGEISVAAQNNEVPSGCSCHPDERPPICSREHAHTHCWLKFQTSRANALTEALDLYRMAAHTDVTMESVHFLGVNRAAFKRAWDADRARHLSPTVSPELECCDRPAISEQNYRPE